MKRVSKWYRVRMKRREKENTICRRTQELRQRWRHMIHCKVNLSEKKCLFDKIPIFGSNTAPRDCRHSDGVSRIHKRICTALISVHSAVTFEI